MTKLPQWIERDPDLERELEEAGYTGEDEDGPGGIGVEFAPFAEPVEPEEEL